MMRFAFYPTADGEGRAPLMPSGKGLPLSGMESR